MTEILAIPADHMRTIGPGRLILVVGPSGAGKDTLLGLAKAACVDESNIVFPRRVITREASASEDNEAVSVGTFEAALARNEAAVVESLRRMPIGFAEGQTRAAAVGGKSSSLLVN